MSTTPTLEPTPTRPASQLPGWADLAAVVGAMIFPSVSTWLYFVALDGSESMKPVYAVSKMAQFLFPVLWVVWIRAGRARIGWPRTVAGLGTGLAIGATVGAAMLVAYQTLVAYTGWLDPGIEQVRAKVLGMGLDTPAKFAALAIFYTVVHSFLEEYFWRWYVFGELRRFTGDRPAIVLSSLGFMAHHVIVLNLYFRDAWWLTALFSASVAIGGVIWAWLYRWSGSLLGPWISHALVDAAIMSVGYLMIWGNG